MASPASRETKWAKALRAALDDVLLDVRYLETPEGVDFLLVHAPGKRVDAVDRFVTALERSGDIPPFEVWLKEPERAAGTEFRSYASVADQ
jgi:hypothetical protein